MNKSLVRNSIYNILYKVISVLYPLVAVTYVSHILMAERMGMVNYAQNIVSYFVILSALGIPTYGIREIAICAEEKNKRSNLFWELFIINFISTTIALIAFLILVFSVSRFRSNLALYLIAGLQIALNYINVDWFYQGLEEYRYISIRSIVVKLVALVSLPIFIKTTDDYINYALIYCMAIAGNNVFNAIRLRKYICLPKGKIKLSHHIKPIIVLLLVSIAVEIYAMIDTTMLGIYCDDSTVGCYSNAMKLTRMVTTTAAAIGAVLFPRLSIVYKNNDKDRFAELVNSGIKVMLVMAIPAAVGLNLLKEDIIIVFFGESFRLAVPILAILSLMVPIVVCNTLMGGQVLVTAGKEKKYMVSVILASISNVLMNAIFIPRYGAPSAAIASLISESIVLCLYLLFSHSFVKINISSKYLITLAIPLVIYILIHYYCLNKFALSNTMNIVINIIVCVLIYFGGGLLLKNETMVFIISKVTKLIHN